MMVSASFWRAYARKLSALDNRAGDLMRRFIEENGLEDMGALISYAYGLVQKYGAASSELACECYELLAEYSGVVVAAAEPADLAEYGEVAQVVQGAANQSFIGALIPYAVSRLVKQATADTMLKNARRDGAQWAWIPVGDTCPYCIQLASDGWQYASRRVAEGDHARHIHASCDCTFAVRFKEDDGVQGYDPERYREMYDAAPGSTEEEKLNAMRRQAYAENREEILEQKRDAYARRQALESDKAEEIDV